MQAILTRYLSPTNTRGARIKAQCDRGSIVIPYPYHLPRGEEMHREAARQLCARFMAEDAKRDATDPKSNCWASRFVTGGLPNGDFAHVFLS